MNLLDETINCIVIVESFQNNLYLFVSRCSIFCLLWINLDSMNSKASYGLSRFVPLFKIEGQRAMKWRRIFYPWVSVRRSNGFSRDDQRSAHYCYSLLCGRPRIHSCKSIHSEYSILISFFFSRCKYTCMCAKQFILSLSLNWASSRLWKHKRKNWKTPFC